MAGNFPTDEEKTRGGRDVAQQKDTKQQGSLKEKWQQKEHIPKN